MTPVGLDLSFLILQRRSSPRLQLPLLGLQYHDVPLVRVELLVLVPQRVVLGLVLPELLDLRRDLEAIS